MPKRTSFASDHFILCEGEEDAAFARALIKGGNLGLLFDVSPNIDVGGVGLTTPLICQTGPKTSAKIGCSCSMREKPCISGRSLASGIMGIRS